MTNYARHFQTRETPASEIADPAQVPNCGGGFSFQVDKWKRLERFLILGAEGGTYYASEKKLTVENAKVVQECGADDGSRAVEIIWGLSMSGRAPKNDPAVFALALLAGSGDPVTRRAALAAMPKVCRTGTHLFQFVEAVQGFRGWGRGLKKGVAAWYGGKSPEDLAYQVAKYAQRGGFSHRDVLRLCHPENTAEKAAIYRYVVISKAEAQTVTRKSGVTEARPPVELPEFLVALEEMKKSGPKEAAALIRKHRFTHEMVTGEQKAHREVWEALFELMPMTALIRHLGKLTSLGIVSTMSEGAKMVESRVTDATSMKKARVHPISILIALATYRKGKGDKGKLTWSPVASVIQALDDGFYQAFETVEPTGKNTMVAVDVSGSMTWQPTGSGLTPREIAMAMAMTVVRTEPHQCVVGFSRGLTQLPITKGQRLDDVMKMVNSLHFSHTDCSLPFLGALENKIPIESFQVWTDNETNSGRMHPHQALKQYREKTGIPAKLAVAAVTSTGFTIADPKDSGMLDVVGFDGAVPSVLANFFRDS